MAALSGLAFCVLALLVQRFDAAPVLGAALLPLAAVPLLVWPEAALLLGVFLLYTNIPFLASDNLGVPELVAAAVILLLAPPLLRRVVVRGGRPRMDRVFPLLLLYFVVLLLASLGARSLGVAVEYTVKFVAEGLLLYFLVINAIWSVPTLRRVIWTVVAAGALLGGLSVYQEVTGSFGQRFGGLAERNHEYLELRRQLALYPDDPGLQEAMRRHGTGERSRRAEGPMDEPNRYGQILVVLLPLAVFSYRTAGSRPARLCAAAIGLLILGGILASQSRGTFVGVALLVVAGVLVRWVRPVHVLVGALALLPLVPIVAPGVIERLGTMGTAFELVQDGEPAAADGAIRGRATAMLAAYHVFLDHPVLGVGPGQYMPFYSVEYQQKDPRRKFRDLQVPRRAHSLYFEMAAELGVVGLGVFLSILGLLLRDLWRARRLWIDRDPATADLATAVGLSLLAYMATAVFLHLSFARYFWLLVALAGAALLVIRDRGADVRERGA